MTSDVRYRADTGWERRCPGCQRAKHAAWWPLTAEFWNPHKLRVCRACLRDRDARRKPVDRTERNRRYREQCAAALAVKRRATWQAIKADSIRLERHREQGRRATRAYRERLAA